MSLSIGELVVEIGMDISPLRHDAARAGAAIQGLGNKVNNAGKGLQNFGRSWSLFITAPLVAFGGFALKFAADIETMQTSFGVLLGDVKKGRDLFEDLKTFSAETPLQLDDIARGSKILLGFGVAGDNIISTMRKLGNAAQGNSAILSRLVNAYGKLKAKGRASLEELNMFTEAGVPILRLLREQTGKNKEELFKMITAGKLGFEQVEKALSSLVGEGGKWGDMMERISKTTTGKFSTAIDNIKISSASLVESFLPMVNKLLDKIVFIAKWVSKLSAGTKRMIVIVGAIVAIIGPAVLILGLIISSMGTIISAFGSFVAMLPLIISIGAAVGTIVFAVVSLVGEGETLQEKFLSVFSMIKNGWDSLGTSLIGKAVFVINFFIKGAGEILKGFSNLVIYIEGAFNAIMRIAKIAGLATAHAFIAPMAGMVSGLREALNDIIKAMNRIAGTKFKLFEATDTERFLDTFAKDLRSKIADEAKALRTGKDFKDAAAKAGERNNEIDKITNKLTSGVEGLGQKLTNLLADFNLGETAKGDGKGGKKLAESVTGAVETATPKFAGAAEKGSVEAFKTIAGSNKINIKIEKNTNEQVKLTRQVVERLGTISDKKPVETFNIA